jgi:hypothetical protein
MYYCQRRDGTSSAEGSMKTGFAGILGLSVLLGFCMGCEDKGDGGFRGADIKDPGVHVKPAKDKGPPNFIGAMRLSPSFDAASGQLTVNVEIREGFHAYAPGSEIGVPVGMTVKADNAWKVEGEVNVPKGEKKSLGTLGTDFVLEGKIPVTAKVSGGTGEIVGDVKVQVCTKNACDRPRTHGFRVPTS